MKDINKYYTICKNKLYPINRSLTGDGVRKTLRLIKKEFIASSFIVDAKKI